MNRSSCRWAVAAFALASAVGLSQAAGPASARAGDVSRAEAVSLATHTIGAWVFVPFESGREVRAYLAYYTGKDVQGDNLTVAWFEREPGGTDWTQYAWRSGDLAAAARFGALRVPGARAYQSDPLISDALRSTPGMGAEAPNKVLFGMFADDPVGQALTQLEEPGAILDLMKRSGLEVTPELPAAFALVDALASGDAKLASQIRAESLGQRARGGDGQGSTDTPSAAPSNGGGATPGEVTEICEVEPVEATIFLGAATPANSERGKNTMLGQLARADESAMFGDGPMIYGFFCGCTTVYGTCTATGAWTFDGSVPTIGGWHCSFVRNGTMTWTKTGLTFWCCNACSGSGTTSCVQTCGCTVTALPCTAAGCGC